MELAIATCLTEDTGPSCSPPSLSMSLLSLELGSISPKLGIILYDTKCFRTARRVRARPSSFLGVPSVQSTDEARFSRLRLCPSGPDGHLARRRETWRSWPTPRSGTQLSQGSTVLRHEMIEPVLHGTPFKSPCEDGSGTHRRRSGEKTLRTRRACRSPHSRGG